MLREVLLLLGRVADRGAGEDALGIKRNIKLNHFQDRDVDKSENGVVGQGAHYLLDVELADQRIEILDFLLGALITAIVLFNFRAQR